MTIKEAKIGEWKLILDKLEGVGDTEYVLVASIRTVAESRIKTLSKAPKNGKKVK